MLAVLSYADSGFGVYIRVSDMHACSSRAGKRREQLSRVESTASQPMKRLLFAADNLISLHPSLMDLPKSIGLRLFRALAMAEVEPDPQREILQWEGIGWKATFIPITVKPHAYFKDAAAEGALSYLTWGMARTGRLCPTFFTKVLFALSPGRKAAYQAVDFFTQALNQEWSDYAIKHCVRRALAIPKRQQGPIILGQAVTPLQPAVISGGGNLHAACRVAGAARSPEAYCVKSCFAKLEGVAVVVPF